MISEYPSRVLIVNNDSTVRDHWCQRLEAVSTTWFEAASLEDARKSLHANQPDLIVYAAQDMGIALNAWISEVSHSFCNQLIVVTQEDAPIDSALFKNGIDIVNISTDSALFPIRARHLLFQKAFQDLTHHSLSGFLDPLTGLFNRILFHDLGEKELNRCQRYTRPMALIIIKVDDLKIINQEYGHKAGDALILHLAQLLSQITRQSDVLARIGNKEFGIILSECNLAQCEIRAKQLVLAIAEQRPIHNGITLPFSVSVGSAEMDTGDVFLEQLIERTDENIHPSGVPLDDVSIVTE